MGSQLATGGQIIPVIDQSGYQPTRYLPLADGPPQIGNFSKDLAFGLYTVPEPSMFVLVVSAVVSGLALRRRR